LAREGWPDAGFRGRAKASAGTDAGVAGILQADQEGSDVASGCRRSGMVQTAGTRLPDENQSGTAEADVGREEDIGGVSTPLAVQASLFDRREENPPYARPLTFIAMLTAGLIAGDSLLVMSSLLEKEGLETVASGNGTFPVAST